MAANYEDQVCGTNLADNTNICQQSSTPKALFSKNVFRNNLT
jgi:hypothetical protein